MKLTGKFSLISLAVVTLIFALSAVSFAQTSENSFSNIKIKNFGQMDERFYRGAQPKKEQDYKDLAALGVTTVIDLQAKPREYEKAHVEALGMRYVNIPMSDRAYPKPEHVNEFLKLTGDAATGKFYVHCAGGRHRTGVMGAAYRFNNYQWNFEQVYAEMKNYDFYTRWGHGKMKDFVEDYWKQIQEKQASETVSTSVTP